MCIRDSYIPYRRRKHLVRCSDILARYVATYLCGHASDSLDSGSMCRGVLYHRACTHREMFNFAPLQHVWQPCDGVLTPFQGAYNQGHCLGRRSCPLRIRSCAWGNFGPNHSCSCTLWKLGSATTFSVSPPSHLQDVSMGSFGHSAALFPPCAQSSVLQHVQRSWEA